LLVASPKSAEVEACGGERNLDVIAAGHLVIS
jgi:hypothetical protein